MSTDDAKTVNILLKKDWTNTELQGVTIFVDKDTRPWLCLNRVPIEVDPGVIANHLRLGGYDCDNVERVLKYNGQKMTLVKFKARDEAQYSKIIREGLKLGDRKVMPKEYIDKDKMLVRCYNCNRIGHFQSGCHAQRSCPRCSMSNCEGNCDRANWKCVNCGGAHSAAYHGCPKIKELIVNATNNAKIRSYAQAVTVNLDNNKKELTKEIKTVEIKMNKVEGEVKNNANSISEALLKINETLGNIENKIKNINDELEKINKKFVTHDQFRKHLTSYYVSAKQLSSLLHTIFQGIFSNKGRDYPNKLDKIIADAIRLQFSNTANQPPAPSPK